MLTRAQKEEAVGVLREKITRATGVYVADYRGLTVTQIDALRAKLRAAGQNEYQVAKNSLLQRASADTPAQALGPWLEGPTAVAFAFGDPVALAKVLVDYAKENEKFTLKGGLMDGKPLQPAEIATIATLPSLDELRGKLVGLLQAPAQRIATVLAAPAAQLARVVEARRGKLAESEGGAPAA
jgi:large subunit ribosomal protein L10